MNNNVNFLESLIDNVEGKFTQDTLIAWENKKSAMESFYYYTNKEIDDIHVLQDKKIKGKKECFIVYEGVGNICHDGYHIQKVEVFGTKEEIKEYMKKNPLLCHVWYFNYNKAIIEKIFGEFDKYDRLYIEKNEFGYYLSDVLGDNYYGDYYFDTIEEAKKDCSKKSISKYIKLYDNKKALENFYK